MLEETVFTVHFEDDQFRPVVYRVLPRVPRPSQIAHAKRGIFLLEPERPDLCIDGAVLTDFGMQVLKDVPKELLPIAKKVLRRYDSDARTESEQLTKEGLALLRNWPKVKLTAALSVSTGEPEPGLWIDSRSAAPFITQAVGYDVKNLRADNVMRQLCLDGFVEAGISHLTRQSSDIIPTRNASQPRVVWRKTPAGEMRGM
jgi:hypothetical protein